MRDNDGDQVLQRQQWRRRKAEQRRLMRVTSLDAPVPGRSDKRWADILAGPDPYDSLVDRLTLEHALEVLPQRLRVIVTWHAGHGVTLSRLGRLLHLSPSRVHRLYHTGIQELRDEMTGGAGHRAR